jgi:alkanesulfonate monooxygenase SsuD/methylene tetrahydromethanopterin reductase-like flavin-dependent oxidoreductase (luciferase family)
LDEAGSSASGGRIVAGLGSGWSTDEFQATGASRAARGRFVDELLDVFEAVWGPNPVNHRSSRVLIENADVLPKPVAKIPVLSRSPSPSRSTVRKHPGTNWRTS